MTTNNQVTAFNFATRVASGEAAITTQHGEPLTHSIRVVSIDDQPWFVGMDICSVLGFSSPKDAYSRLDADEKRYEARTLLGMHPGKPLVLISESGLYKLIMRSDKPQATHQKQLVNFCHVPKTILLLI